MCDGREVATARAVTVRRSELDLPEKALAQANPFDPAAARLPMAEPNRSAADVVGWECFDSWSLIIDFAVGRGRPAGPPVDPARCAGRRGLRDPGCGARRSRGRLREGAARPGSCRWRSGRIAKRS